MRIALPETAEYTEASAAQGMAADPNASAWVSANAGSGKTKVLIDRVARLLLRGAEPDQILCITYTKAAANEMLSRLFDRLGEWSVMDTGELSQTLARLEGHPPGHVYSTKDLRRARTLFARALETPGGLRIETIHAFCSRILTRFPLEAGIPPGFSQIEDAAERALWQEAVNRTVLAAADDAALSDALDTIVTEGAGKGFSVGEAVLRARRHDIAEFAERHDGELRSMSAELQRYLKAPGEDRDTLIRAAMVDAFPLQRLRNIAGALSAATGTKDSELRSKLLDALGQDDPQKRLDVYASVMFTQKGERRKSVYTKTAAALCGPDLEAVFGSGDGVCPEADRLEQLLVQLRRRAAFERTLSLLTFGLPVLATYTRLKRARSALDFDDLIHAVRDLLTRKTSSDWVLYKLDGNLSHILLDEAQDTSPAQWELIDALTAEFFAGQGAERADAPRTKFVVGDQKQSIYSFQGADPQVFGIKRRAFSDQTTAAEARAEQPNMAMSFRSTPDVLHFVDTVLAKLRVSPGDPTLAEPPVSADFAVRHTAHRSILPGCVELRDIKPPPPVEEADPWTAPVDALSQASPKLELARWIAGRCKEMVDRGEAVWTPDEKGFIQRPATPGDILILVQTRTGGLFDSIISSLKAVNLPVAGADRLVLSEHIGVQDMLNLMRFALNPDDDLTLAEIIRGPFVGLTDDDNVLFRLCCDAEPGVKRERTLWRAVRDSAMPELASVKPFLEGLRSHRQETPYEFLQAALGHCFPDGTNGREKLVARLGAPVVDPLEELLSAALASDARSAGGLQAFVYEQENADTQIKRDLARPDGEIRVMTVHGAKGLEAPVVFLADTNRSPKGAPDAPATPDGGPPVWLSGKQQDDPPELSLIREEAKMRAEEEHHRLLYVAMTRAMDRLVVCGPFAGSKTGTGIAKGSWFGFCREAMETLGAEKVSSEDGPDMFVFGTRPPALGKGATASAEQSARPAWMDQIVPSTSGRDPLVPSQATRDDAPALVPFGPDQTRRYRRGLLIHALFERLPDLPEARRRDAAMNFLAHVDELTADDREEIAKAALSVLDSPDFGAVFGPGSRAEVPIAGRIDGRRVSGRVDRLVVGDDHVLIVDFKTDRPAAQTPDQVDPAYLVQLGAYRRVLQGAYPGRDIRCALLWTDGPRLMSIEADRIEAAFTAARAGLRSGESNPM